MHDAVHCVFFGLTPDTLIAAKSLAPRHPDARFLFAENKRVEETAGTGLNADHRAAPLAQIVKPHPGFDGFCAERSRKRQRGRMT